MSNGKLIDTWYYEYKGIEASTPVPDGLSQKAIVTGIKVPIQLRLIKKLNKDQEPPLEVNEVSFLVTCKEASISLSGTDIELLRAAMWEKLDAKYSVKWEQYYKVQIREATVYDGIGTGFTFEHSDVEKGTAWDGTLLMRTFEHRTWKIEPWPDKFKDDRGHVLALIPATQSNKEALDAFMEKINALRDALSKFLEPDMIMTTLAHLKMPLLLDSVAQSQELFFGGYDYVIHQAPRAEDRQVIMSEFLRHWPDALFEDVDDNWATPLSQAIEKNRSSVEFFIYRDQRASDRWDSAKVSRAEEPGMVHVILGNEITIVIDSAESEQLPVVKRIESIVGYR